MKKLHVILLVFCIISGKSLWADEGNDNFPRNTITIDVGTPYDTLLTSAFTGDPFFGSAIQYERQILPNFSVAGRMEYIGLWFLDSDSSISTVTAGLHGRYYPNGRSFFLDYMVGYANLYIVSISDDDIMGHYFKTGGKIGWRIDFGKPGGFVLEPAFGIYFPFGPNIQFVNSEGWGWGLLNFFSNMLARTFVAGFGGSLGMGFRF